MTKDAKHTPVYRVTIEAVFVCNGGEGNPAHTWDGDAIAEALKEIPDHGCRASWFIKSSVELDDTGTVGE